MEGCRKFNYVRNIQIGKKQKHIRDLLIVYFRHKKIDYDLSKWFKTDFDKKQNINFVCTDAEYERIKDFIDVMLLYW